MEEFFLESSFQSWSCGSNECLNEINSKSELHNDKAGSFSALSKMLGNRSQNTRNKQKLGA